jgi:hypothetical protein
MLRPRGSLLSQSREPEKMPVSSMLLLFLLLPLLLLKLPLKNKSFRVM